ncbi:MAG TPA: DUF3341 domain-containing protein [Chthoniobacteraceae bacterium]|nr:DUF3341 domain-containing protein [Chthoniobacteraceae bacterium]
MEKTHPEPVYGVMAEYENARQLLAAAREARKQGYVRMDAYTPYPVEGLAAIVEGKRSRLPLVFLLGGLIGGGGGYAMEWYAMVLAYPINVGGRPLHSWPSFIPVTFELTILLSALSGMVALLIATRLPRLHHPVFAVPEFERATVDRFFLCIEATDGKFSPDAVTRFLETTGPVMVKEVPRC